MVLSVLRNVALSHFFFKSMLASMRLFMVIEEDPVRSLSLVIVAMIPALYNMVVRRLLLKMLLK